MESHLALKLKSFSDNFPTPAPAGSKCSLILYRLICRCLYGNCWRTSSERKFKDTSLPSRFFKKSLFFQLYYRTDLPANELVQRHKISSCGSSGSINSHPSTASPNLKNCKMGFPSNPSINLSISPLHHISTYKRSLSHTPSHNSASPLDDKR
jgi:hypothetical protein